VQALAGHGVKEVTAFEMRSGPPVKAMILPAKEFFRLGAEPGGSELQQPVDDGGSQAVRAHRNAGRVAQLPFRVTRIVTAEGAVAGEFERHRVEVARVGRSDGDFHRGSPPNLASHSVSEVLARLARW
jgi:hypothetical protein